MADKLFTLHIVILNHPAALPDAAEQPLVTGRNGSICDRRAATRDIRISSAQHGTLRSTKPPPQSRHSTRIEQANPGATHKWNILTSLNEDLMKTLKS